MKKYSMLLYTILFSFLTVEMASAELIDLGKSWIYDTDLNISWSRDANYFYSHPEAGSDLIAGGATFGFYAGTAIPLGRLPRLDEMWHLYHEEHITADTPGPFINLEVPYREFKYWSVNKVTLDYSTYLGWFSFLDGGDKWPWPEDEVIIKVSNSFHGQVGGVYYVSPEEEEHYRQIITQSYGYHGFGSDFGYSWVVVDGDLSDVPEPITIWLLGIGLTGITGIRKILDHK